MKRCPYCGAEYPDDTEVCTLDRQPLPPSGNAEVEIDRTKPVRHTWPEYQWSARDGWKCLGMFLLLELLLIPVTMVMTSCLPGFAIWLKTAFGFLCASAVIYGASVLIIFHLSKTEWPSTFWKAFGLGLKPSRYVWIGLAGVVTVRFGCHLIYLYGWETSADDEFHSEFKSATVAGKLIFAAGAALLAPCFEELIFRGFIYKAFRRSYSIAGSIALLVACTAITHSPDFFSSWLTGSALSIWTIIQCYVREKSESLWDCIICHAAFNGWLLIYYAFG